jgi:putative addiction module CopG family antidote
LPEIAYAKVMTISLSKEQEQVIKQQLATGQFASENEVLNEALSLLQRRGEALQKLRAEVQRGLDDLGAGRYTTISNSDEAKAFADEIKRRGRELNAKRGQPSH